MNDPFCKTTSENSREGQNVLATKARITIKFGDKKVAGLLVTEDRALRR